ncbi:MAG: MFS transporter, partial [Candidatus Hydrogenedentes bacterium]|nr:MFS transporter [Candidatus Hydrogenedentota bacterium]
MEWGGLGAISWFAITTQLATAYGAGRSGYRRAIWFVLELTSRILRAVAIVVAYLLVDRGFPAAAPYVLVGLMCVASFASAGSQPPWYSWLADIIPERIHGTFMGRRDVWLSFATVALVVPASFAVDRAPHGTKIHALSLVFALGLAVGMVDLFLHRQIPEPRPARDTEGTFVTSVLAPLRDPSYRRWLVFTVSWNFAVFLGGALATIFFIEDLRIRDHLLGGALVLVAVPLVSIMITGKTTGRLVDRVGVKRVLIGSHFLWALLPIFWVFATPATALFWLAVSSALGGSGCSAAVNASYKIMTRVPPRNQRAMYIAVAACVGNLAGGLATLLAGYFLEGLKGHEWMLAGMIFVPFHIIFVVSMVLRLGAWG